MPCEMRICPAYIIRMAARMRGHGIAHGFSNSQTLALLPGMRRGKYRHVGPERHTRCFAGRRGACRRGGSVDCGNDQMRLSAKGRRPMPSPSLFFTCLFCLIPSYHLFLHPTKMGGSFGGLQQHITIYDANIIQFLYEISRLS